MIDNNNKCADVGINLFPPLKSHLTTDFSKTIMEQRSTVPTLDPITKAILEGVYDKECVLFKLNGLWHILKRIMQDVKKYWKESVIDTRPIRNKMKFEDGDIMSYIDLSSPIPSRKFRPFSSLLVGPVFFPKSKKININMMPFIFATHFKDCRLPKYLKAYWKNIISMCIMDDEQIGKVCYLTIQESKVKENFSQRRPGIHTEKPGKVELRVGQIDDADKGQGNAIIDLDKNNFRWGTGRLFNYDRCIISGGIFMASNVADSCRVWDCQIMNDNCIGHLGDIEHLRSLLPESEVMKPNCLYWLTDRTPHESLPLKNKTHRQFFRLVTSEVSLWFEEHSTKNPLGVVPDPKITSIVKGSKFNKGEAYIA